MPSSVPRAVLRRMVFAVVVGLGLSGLLACPSVAAEADGPIYTVVVNHAPPYRIVEERNGALSVSGIYVDIIRSLARHANIRVRFEKTSFQEALSRMVDGSADMMLGPNRTSEREAFMAFIDAPLSREPKVFIRGPGAPAIAEYGDLAALRIGVLKNAKYAPRFDGDATLGRIEFPTYEKALAGLAANEVDTVIIPELLGRYLVRSSAGTFVTMPFRLPGRLSYIAVSRKSRLASRSDELAGLLRHLIIDGTVERINSRYR